MDVSKIFAKSSAQLKQETTEDGWESEGGAIYAPPEDNITEKEKDSVKKVLSRPIPALISMTTPVSDLHPLSQKFLAALNEVRQLHFRKGADYGTQEDPFFNIRDGCEEFGISPWKAAAKAANDPMVRIKQYAKTGTLENESVRDSFLDAANYFLIALVLWEEENEKES